MKKLTMILLMSLCLVLVFSAAAFASSGEPSAEPSAEPAAETAEEVVSGSFEVNFKVNGEVLKTAKIGVEFSGNEYRFQIAELLDVLGVELSYDEQTGIAVISAAGDGPFEEILGASGEPSGEPADAENASGEPSAEPDASGEASAEPAAPAQPATEEEYEAYEAYCREYMENYDGVGDGTFDDGARLMALGELDSVSFGSDVNAFPFEMYVTVFGADDYATFVSKK